MSVLTLDIITEAMHQIERSIGLTPDKIMISQSLFNDLLELQKWENWVRTLGPRREKQERLRAALKSRIGKFKYKIPLPK